MLQWIRKYLCQNTEVSSHDEKTKNIRPPHGDCLSHHRHHFHCFRYFDIGVYCDQQHPGTERNRHISIYYRQNLGAHRYARILWLAADDFGQHLCHRRRYLNRGPSRAFYSHFYGAVLSAEIIQIFKTAH